MSRLLSAVLTFLVVFVAGNVRANDITVTNVSTYVDAGETFIEFDLSWDNSWRVNSAPANYDAAWVFVKYKDTDGLWKHLDLSSSHNNPGTTFTLDKAPDGKGYFIYRSLLEGLGTGNISIFDIRLGVENPPTGSFELKVFAIEMVFVPQAGFYIGDGNGSSYSQGSLMKQDDGFPVVIGASFQPGITSEGSNDDDEILDTQGIGIAGNAGLDTNNDGTIDNPLYPTGYKAFYCMKYEVSLRGIVDFVNTLTLQQQDFLGTNPLGESSPQVTDLGVEVLGTGGANPVPAIFGVDTDGDGIFNETEDNETGAASDLRWRLLASYLDWAALRPMTELEFEKVSRGVTTPILNEYAWGTDGINASAHTIVNPKSSNEAVSSALDPNGNAVYLGHQSSSLRCGIFANGSTSRKTAGAAYYGAMEMSGNAGETVVSLGNVAGRSFTGKLGDGLLTVQGFANEDHWPGINGNFDPDVPNNVATTGVSNAAGIGTRGGDFTDGATRLRLSDRMHATNMELIVVGRGGRGVRQLN